MKRCLWTGEDQIYIDYHDNEWGVPEYNSHALFEKLILDGFQAGLSWLTILKKRDNFRKAFNGFDPKDLSTWRSEQVDLLLQDSGIIRHRGKIEATINNAKIFLQIEIYDHHFSKINKFLKKFKFSKINSFSSDGKIDYYYKNY